MQSTHLTNSEGAQLLIEVRDLEVRFATQTVLRGINLAIPSGQTVALIGESGCGKTRAVEIADRLDQALPRGHLFRRPKPGEHAGKTTDGSTETVWIPISERRSV